MWTIESNGKVLEVLGPMMSGGARIIGVSAAEQKEWAESLGARLPTAIEFDTIWQSANVRVPCHPRPILSAPKDSLHQDILAEYERIGRPPEPRIACGKTWVSDGATDKRASNYGWFVPLGQCLQNGMLWRGLKVYTPALAAVRAEWRVVQPIGHAHDWHHADYSQAGYAVREVACETDPGPPPSGPKHIASEPQIPAAAPPASQDSPGEQRRDEIITREILPFVPARNFTPGRKVPIRLIVLHSTENPIAPHVARNVAKWFAGPGAPRASSHYVVGPDETIQCVTDSDTAWAAPGANHDGIQIEMVGQALRTNWLSKGSGPTDGYAVFEATAKLMAMLCRKHGLPVAWVDAGGLIDLERGITTHAAVTRAYKRSTHVDPGGATDSRWPWNEFLALIRAQC